MKKNFEKARPLPILCKLEQTSKTNTGTCPVPGEKIECFVLQTRFICGIPRGRLPPWVCLSLAVSTAAQQEWPSTRFIFPPSKRGHSRERQQGRKLQQLRPCATSGTNQTKKMCHRKNYSLRTREQERARDERCQSPSSLTAEHAGIGGISWAFSTG